MQPDDETDELQALLREEYGAPPLDKQFSADLISRLQAETVSSSTPTSVPASPRRSPLAICLAIATVAALVLAVIWISQPGTPATIYEVARHDEGKSNRSQLLDLSDLSQESKPEGVDHLSESSRSMSLSRERESMPSRESLSDRSESESKYSRESLVQSKESLATEERKPRTLSLITELSVLSPDAPEWPNIMAAVALSDMFYVVDSGHLYEVNAKGGSRRSVGEADWRNTAAMGAAGGNLYLVCDNLLYEVNPKTGKRHSLGKPDWANTKAIMTIGDMLYIAANGQLHRVNPRDGSHEVLPGKGDRPNHLRQPKP